MSHLEQRENFEATAPTIILRARLDAAIPRLCYVSGCWAYFTTQAVEQQWGDDWDDAPYEHNAGSPYDYCEDDRERGAAEWRIVRIAWEGPYDSPSTWVMNSPYSVQGINARQTPWLRGAKFTHEQLPPIWAGTPLREFCEQMRDTGGRVWMEMG